MTYFTALLVEKKKYVLEIVFIYFSEERVKNPNLSRDGG